MGLIAARCTQCNANIEVDSTQEAGICKYCGTAFITEKAVNNYNTYITNNNNFAGANINVVNGNIDNLIKMAENAIDAGNGKEAIDYANRALEIDPESSKAWLLKMKAIEYIGTIGNTQVTEAITYAENAIKYSDEKEKTEEEVYYYYIKRASSLIIIAISNLRDVDKIKQLTKVGFSISTLQAISNGDNTTRSLYLNLATDALLLKLKVPEKFILEHEDMQDKIVALAKLYIGMCQADVDRLKLYGSALVADAITARENVLREFKSGLPEEKAKEVNDADVKPNTGSGGCYIATCVYGSYDCPQVWTLRRFRDYTLDETWYGRLFIKCYYAISPTLVKWFGETSWFKRFWKFGLDKMVKYFNDNGVEDTCYTDKY